MYECFHCGNKKVIWDGDFDGTAVQYLLGMSVPPVMIKRLVTRIIDTGVFNK